MLKKVLSDFVTDKLGTVIVNDRDGSIIYMGRDVHLSPRAIGIWNKMRPEMGETSEWELGDSEKGRFYQVFTSDAGDREMKFQCHILNDVTVYSNLIHEVNTYSRQINDEKKFQDRIMKKLTLPYDSCLVDLVSYCHAGQGLIFMEAEDGKNVFRSSFISFLSRDKLEMSEELEEYLSGNGRFDDNNFVCFISGTACRLRYALYLERTPAFSDENFENPSVRNVLNLFIENSILREKHIYASEHDKLTGLYNKGKYMALKSESFGRPEKIAVFNMDVNNLKKVNDSQGHEAGDNLIIKAADSINAIITSDDIMGFRVGGDEFVVVAKNLDEKGANDLMRTWRNTLNILNAKDDGIKITVACGMVCAEGDYDIEEVLERADGLMYKNKTELKQLMGGIAR